MKLLFILFYTFFCVTCVSISKKTDREIKHLTDLAEPKEKNSEIPIKKEDSYVMFLKKILPLIKEGSTVQEVDRMLLFDQKFRGIITSEGRMNHFSYFYELRGYHLVLVFDYTKSRQGYYKGYELNNYNSI